MARVEPNGPVRLFGITPTPRRDTVVINIRRVFRFCTVIGGVLSPTLTVQLHDLRDDFAGNEFRARWHAAELIQRNARAASARWGVARALMGAWTKEYDDQAERYAFVHKKKREIQYHKPWGMGTVDLWASAEEKVDEVLLSLFLGIEVGNPIYSHTDICFAAQQS